jgi:hypothetical protein
MKKMIDKISLLSQYHVLHDSEFPMLMIGKNSLGDYVMASFLEEDDVLGRLKYFHVLAEDEDILNLLTRNISYLDVMRKANGIFLVEKSYNYAILKVEKVIFSSLTKDMLPLKSSFFTTSIPSISTNLERRIRERKNAFAY